MILRWRTERNGQFKKHQDPEKPADQTVSAPTTGRMRALQVSADDVYHLAHSGEGDSADQAAVADPWAHPQGSGSLRLRTAQRMPRLEVVRSAIGLDNPVTNLTGHTTLVTEAFCLAVQRVSIHPEITFTASPPVAKI